MKQKFFDLAKKMSRHSTHRQFRIGCVIVKGNNIISLGFNQKKTHSKAPGPYKQLHAEIAALIAGERKDLNKCHAYTFREHKNGTLAMSKPCESCQMALQKAGITAIFYTDETSYKELALND